MIRQRLFRIITFAGTGLESAGKAIEIISASARFIKYDGVVVSERERERGRVMQTESKWKA